MQTPHTGFRHSRARCSSPPRRAFRAIARVAATAALALLTGCNAMSSPQEAGMELAVKIDTSKPIQTHSFGAHCFGGFGCQVRYDGKFIRDRPEAESNPEVPGNDLESRLVAPYAGIRNFPSAAHVAWTTADGSRLSVEVDIAAIVAEWLARTSKSRLQSTEPEVFLVVIDRTVNVMIRSPFQSTFHGAGTDGLPKKEIVRVFSKTY